MHARPPSSTFPYPPTLPTEASSISSTHDHPSCFVLSEKHGTIVDRLRTSNPRPRASCRLRIHRLSYPSTSSPCPSRSSKLACCCKTSRRRRSPADSSCAALLGFTTVEETPPPTQGQLCFPLSYRSEQWFGNARCFVLFARMDPIRLRCVELCCLRDWLLFWEHNVAFTYS